MVHMYYPKAFVHIYMMIATRYPGKPSLTFRNISRCKPNKYFVFAGSLLGNEPCSLQENTTANIAN